MRIQTSRIVQSLFTANRSPLAVGTRALEPHWPSYASARARSFGKTSRLKTIRKPLKPSISTLQVAMQRDSRAKTFTSGAGNAENESLPYHKIPEFTHDMFRNSDEEFYDTWEEDFTKTDPWEEDYIEVRHNGYDY